MGVAALAAHPALDRLLGRLGIDGSQFRALVRVGLKLDFRSPSTLQHGTSGAARWVPMLIMYLALGLSFSAIALFVPDVFFSSSIVLSAVMFLIGSSILIEFAVVVISPLDYDVLGFQPISSRTYFSARLANVLFYTLVMTTSVAVPPIVAYCFTRGFNPVLGAAAFLAFYAASVATTVAMIVAYVGMAQRVHPQRLKRVLTYVQLVMSFAIYGGYFMLPEVFKPAALGAWNIHKSAWMLLYPPTWFASYLDLAIGHWSSLEIVPALASVAALVLLARLAAGRLSLEYSDVLSRQASASEGTQRPGRALLPIGRAKGERRAVALLLRAQFRHDQRFRFAVLSIVPLTAFYILLGGRQGGFHDPFGAQASGGDTMLLYFAMLMFPAMLLTNIGRSDAYRAGWVFYVTPARRGELVLAAKHFALMYLVVPYALCLGVVLGYLFGNYVHAYLHLLVEGLFVNLVLLASVAVQPELPFSKPPMQKGQQTAAFFVVIFVAAIAQALSTFLLSRFVYPYPMVLIAVVAVLLVAGVGGDRLLRGRLDRLSSEMEFAV